MTRIRLAFGGALFASTLSLAGCANESGEPSPGVRSDVSEGAGALKTHGCGACHVIPGIAGADGVVGPPLVDMGRRVYIGRGLPNTPENMIRWIRSPQAIAPGSAMPDMHVSAAAAKSMTDYLYASQ